MLGGTSLPAMKILLKLLLALSAWTTAIAGPFGLTMGTKVADLDVSEKEGRISYMAKSVPSPNSRFESYGLFISDQHGLGKVVAIGNTIATSVYGEGIRSEFEALRGLLNKKYGEGKLVDFLQGGSIWNEPKDWMMGLVKRERVLLAYWATKETMDLPDQIQNIGLEVRAISDEKAYVILTYEFKNWDAILEEGKRSEQESL